MSLNDEQSAPPVPPNPAVSAPVRQEEGEQGVLDKRAAPAATHVRQNAISLIADERERQLAVERYWAAHDDCHEYGELAEAAAAYALVGKLTDETLIDTVREVQLNSSRGIDGDYDYGPVRDKFQVFPWDEEWWKPSDDPIRNLVKAGALIVAEIERLQRKGTTVQ